MSQDKAVSHPDHYTSHPSGVECIQITEHMGFNLGNALKYIWRADLKHESPVQDLEKAMFYLVRELEKIEKARQPSLVGLLPEDEIGHNSRRTHRKDGGWIPARWNDSND